MADTKISALTSNPGIDGTEAMPTAKAGSNFKNTLTELRTWLNIPADFSDLGDAYDLALASAYTVPMLNGSGALAPVNIFESAPISVDAATTAALAGTWTYNNGAAGVGATLTRTTNGAFENQDGVTPAVGKRYLLKNWTGANRLRNGVYSLTTVGSAGAAAVLTRTTDSDATAELDGQNVIPSGGTLNRGLIFRQTTASPTVGTSIIVYQTNSVASPSTVPTSITVAAAQALITNGTVSVGRWYQITDPTQVSDTSTDKIWIQGATPTSFSQVALYIDGTNNQVNSCIYKIDDTPTEALLFRRDNKGNEIWDFGNYGTLLTFRWGSANFHSNTVKVGFNALSLDSSATLIGNSFGDQCTISDQGFADVVISENQTGSNVTIIAGAISATCRLNTLGAGASVAFTNSVIGCKIGRNCIIDDGGFALNGCTFPDGAAFTADKDYANVDFSFIKDIKTIDDTDSPYTVIETDNTILGDTDGNVITVNLESAVGWPGRITRIKNIGGSGNNLTVDADGTEEIDGALTKVLTDGQAVTIQSDGANWWIISQS